MKHNTAEKFRRMQPKAAENSNEVLLNMYRETNELLTRKVKELSLEVARLKREASHESSEREVSVKYSHVKMADRGVEGPSMSTLARVEESQITGGPDGGNNPGENHPMIASSSPKDVKFSNVRNIPNLIIVETS